MSTIFIYLGKAVRLTLTDGIKRITIILRCYDKGEATNNFEAILVWEKDQTFLFANYENIDAQFDCNSQKYALV